MKKYFLYELKKHLWTLIILTAACVLPYVVSMATMQMTYEYEDWETGTLNQVVQNPNIEGAYMMLLVLLFVYYIISLQKNVLKYVKKLKLMILKLQICLMFSQKTDHL